MKMWNIKMFSFLRLDFSFSQQWVWRWLSFGMLCDVVWYKFTDISGVLTASIIMVMMKAVNASETSVNLYQTTWHNIPKDSHLLRFSLFNAHLYRALFFVSCSVHYVYIYEIWGSYGCEDVIVGFWVVTPWRWRQYVCSSKTLVSIYKLTWCYNPEDQHQ
jgi:hypothetical protein